MEREFRVVAERHDGTQEIMSLDDVSEAKEAALIDARWRDAETLPPYYRAAWVEARPAGGWRPIS